jgi:anti-anti-sigma factor
MQLQTKRVGEVDVIVPSGSIHAEDVPPFDEALSALRRRSRFTVVIDASDLDYVNSRAIGLLVQFARDARLGGGKIALVRPGPGVEKILRAVGLLSLIPAYDTVDQAVAACSE